MRHGEGLARAGDAEQHLVLFLRDDAIDEFDDRRRLVSGGRVFGDDPERLAAFGFCGPRRPEGREGGGRLEIRAQGFEPLARRLAIRTLTQGVGGRNLHKTLERRLRRLGETAVLT